MKRSSNSKQFLSSKMASSSTKLWKPTLSTASLTESGHSSGRNNGKIDRQQTGPLYCSRRFQDTIQVDSSFIVSSNKTESIFLTVASRRDRQPSPERGSGKGTKSGNSQFLFPDIPCTKKERKVTSRHRPPFSVPRLSFPYLDDWLIRNLIHNRLLYQTKYCLQVIQNGFYSKPKKSELIPAQNFTFIGM